MWKFIRFVIQKFNYDIRISHKLIILILCMVVVPVISLGFLFYSKSESIVRNEISYSYGQVVNQYTDNINYKLSIYQNLMENIIMNITVQKIFENQSLSTKADTVEVGTQISGEIDSLIYGKNTNEIQSIRLYALSDNFPIDGKYISNLSTIKDEPWYSTLDKNKLKDMYILTTSEGLKKQIISFVKPIVNFNGKNFNERLGVVKLDIDVEKLFDLNNMMFKVKCSGIYITDLDNKLITSTADKTFYELNITELNNLISIDKNKKIFDLKAKKQIITYNTIGKYGWKVLFVFPYSEIEGKMLDIGMPILIIIFILLSVLIGLSIIFSNNFSKRINRLISKMRKVQEGNLQITETIKGKDEIGMVDTNFNMMVDRLNESITENYIEKLERREAELNALQMQINPHFLYNTLETINSISSIYGCTEVCTMSQNLGEMFRYSINIRKNEFIRLKDEIQNIRNYISIQLIRFDNRFEVVFNITEEIMMCHVLKLILQPIIENSFIHGFKGKKHGGRMEVSAIREGENLIIKIEDNGNGMSEEKLSELNTYLTDKEDRVVREKRRSIGIKNVNSRIKLSFGDIYGIKIESKENNGTTVSIILPYMV